MLRSVLLRFGAGEARPGGHVASWLVMGGKFRNGTSGSVRVRRLCCGLGCQGGLGSSRLGAIRCGTSCWVKAVPVRLGRVGSGLFRFGMAVMVTKGAA